MDNSDKRNKSSLKIKIKLAKGKLLLNKLKSSFPLNFSSKPAQSRLLEKQKQKYVGQIVLPGQLADYIPK